MPETTTATTNTRMTFPHTFRAGNIYRWSLTGLTALGVVGGATVGQRVHVMGVLIWALTGLYLLLLATILSLSIQAHGEGLTQRWLFNRITVPWKQILRVDRTRRGYALLGKDNRELILMNFLTQTDQQMLADEAINRARLKKSGETANATILEQWTRK
ncbi:MAG: PH domain-containing protein [Armatimonadota bacterium]|nr:PH domain-containing protein [Armatimonadota bacterium]